MPHESQRRRTMKNLSGLSILITGGLGMIGSTLALKLIEQGAKVSILDALLPLYGGNLFNLGDQIQNVELCIADIRDAAAVRHVVSDKDVIFNFAAQVSYTDSVTDPLLDLDINCRGHLILLEACRQQNIRPHILFSSSRMVYGKTLTCPVDENHPTNPLMPYAIHKLAGEKYHLMYAQNCGIPCTIARIANPYGPRQQMKHSKYGIVNWFIRQTMMNEVIQIFGDGAQLRDYIYVSDIADAFISLMMSPDAQGEVFNIGSGTGTSLATMAKTVVAYLGHGEVQHIPWPENYANVETGDYVSDLEKLKRVTGWAPRVDLAEGVRRTFHYYHQFGDYYWMKE